MGLHGISCWHAPSNGHLGHNTVLWVLVDGLACLWLPCHPHSLSPPSPHPPPVDVIRDITGVLKDSFGISYEILAI